MASKDRLRELHDANAEILKSLDLAHRMRETVRAARKLESADAAAITLLNEAGDALVIRAQEGLSETYVARQRIPMAQARTAYREAGEHRLVEFSEGSLGDADLIQSEGLVRALAVPLMFQGNLMGALTIFTKDPQRSFDAEDIEVAHILAATAATGITNSRLYAEALAQRELQRQLLHALGDGVIIAWPDGSYETNPRAREILGVGKLESLAKLRTAVDVRDMGTGKPTALGQYPMDRALRGELSVGEYLVTRPDTGAQRELHVSAAPVRGPEGAVLAAIMTLHDITDLRLAEREREQFLSIVSHELRTPLTPLKALAQLVRARMRRARQQATALDMESLDRNLAAIERQVDRMNGLVNDLLSVARAEKGSLRMERVPFDLAGLVRDVVQRYVDATADEGRHSFTVDAPPSFPAHGDQSRIEQLLMNLVGNAVKYTPTGGEVKVAVTSEDGEVEIAISDDGIGIPPEDVPRLAHPFVRGTGRAGTFAGMGVGLYVARIVAEAHSGSLALESEGDGKGTTVRVRLPL
ncbi:MAG TPA: ATP-binding protein [Candidatus Limnocylindria bacterium]|nr:ATP-binding protein [Candidatus Limnocylindria bacterium]